MVLLRSRYGKARMRVMRVVQDGDWQIPRELEIKVMLQGEFGRSYTDADNGPVVATDTMKNIVHTVSREALNQENEAFCAVLADRFLQLYPAVSHVSVRARAPRWQRVRINDVPHPHGFVLDANGQDIAEVEMDRESRKIVSGIAGFAVMKTTGSGFEGFHRDQYTTLPETDNRICATSLDARWHWAATPTSYAEANALALATMVDVFIGTYSISVQDSLYRMGRAVLDQLPDVSVVDLAAPNRHYIPVPALPGVEATAALFLPTDEPHGQIECSVGRA